MGSNTRVRQLSFAIDHALTIHGFAGYFDCSLYKDIGFSTVPETHSPGMFSWFPMFLPITRPLRLKPGDEVGISAWRCVTESGQMWYEWCVDAPSPQSIQNANGVSFSVKL